MADYLLEVKNLETRFQVRKGFVYAVNGVSFNLKAGETLGVVGESGCGKSVTMLSLLRLLPPAARIIQGQSFFMGNDLLKLRMGDLRKVRGAKIGMIFQDPMTCLNPVMRIGSQMEETLIYHRNMSSSNALKKCAELLEKVGITSPQACLNQYPHELSGGMRQRVMIAMALSCKPELIIADEPTTALDVTIQAQIVDLVKDLRNEFGMAVIWITHDLSVIAGLAQRMLVMYAGTIVEEAGVDELYADPRHPYTLGLINSLPSAGETRTGRLISIPGAPPNLRTKPTSCPFMPRCQFAIERCVLEVPLLRPVSEIDQQFQPDLSYDHKIACWVNISKIRQI
jgi:oligopeptide/dipeptide ABC transporter ATP-binding protein